MRAHLRTEVTALRRFMSAGAAQVDRIAALRDRMCGAR
jgi:hypothetical protein